MAIVLGMPYSQGGTSWAPVGEALLARYGPAGLIQAGSRHHSVESRWSEEGTVSRRRMRNGRGDRNLIVSWTSAAAVATMLLAAVVATMGWASRTLAGLDPEQAFADAENRDLVETGRRIYAVECAGCHGADLKGQPDWQYADASGRAKAPPHDETGHSFEHSDADLFRTVKFGVWTHRDRRVEFSMPAFASRLMDEQILAVLAFIKSRWPTGVRASQATLNPGLRGLPAEGDWTFAADCRVLR